MCKRPSEEHDSPTWLSRLSAVGTQQSLGTKGRIHKKNDCDKAESVRNTAGQDG